MPRPLRHPQLNMSGAHKDYVRRPPLGRSTPIAATGLKPVVLDQRLVRAAGTSARYQASRGRIGHRGPGGSRAWDRARSAGYSPHLTAENVASGQKSFSEAMRGWERSASHKRNLLLPDAEAAGVAVSYRNGRAYYTLVLGAE